MRIALLSDVHGNSIALDAVLADIQAQGGVDVYWVLGDLAALGYDPAGALERLASLPNVCFARGNTDRYVTTGEQPLPAADEVRDDPRALQILVEVVGSFAWTKGAVTATGRLDWLGQLPLEQRLVLPDGTRLLGVHAAPGADDGLGIYPTTSDAELRAVLQGCAADLVCVGHTHWPMERELDGIRVVNLGSVSNPMAPDLRASYALLAADESGYALRPRRVDYDHAAVIAAIERSHQPGAAYLLRFQRGEAVPRWKVGAPGR